jgi:putative hydrolase of the HAD superfamily
VRGVIFDLWQTLVDWPLEQSRALRRNLAERVGVSLEEMERRWLESHRARETGPLADALRAVGLADDHVEAHVAERYAVTRAVLHPRAGVVETLDELRRRGIRLGLISMCTEEVPGVWHETALAGRFDSESFSATCGLVKPEPEIYLQTAERLGVEPTDCLFVGDGANDELGGAARVGMTPVLIVPDGEEPLWDEVKGWNGLRVSSIPEVLELC